MEKSEFKEFIDQGMATHKIEARILFRLVKAFKDAENPVTEVWYDTSGEEVVKVKSLRSIQEEVFNLDECWLVTRSGGWVYFILGNRWDAISDYTLDLEDALAPVEAWIEQHAD